MNYNNISLKIAITFILLAGTMSVAMAGTKFEGTIKGVTCFANKILCPVDRFDPIVNSERNYVIVEKDNSYHYIQNIDRFYIKRNLFNKVRITGVQNAKYKTLEAEIFEVYKNGKWREVWSLEAEEEELDELFSDD